MLRERGISSFAAIICILNRIVAAARRWVVRIVITLRRMRRWITVASSIVAKVSVAATYFIR
jgi:hypothetical protein